VLALDVLRTKRGGFRTMMGVEATAAVSKMISLGVDVVGFKLRHHHAR